MAPLTPAAVAALLDERPQTTRPARTFYPWRSWSETGVIHVAVQGIDFHCSASQFARVLTTYARRHGLTVRRSTFTYDGLDRVAFILRTDSEGN